MRTSRVGDRRWSSATIPARASRRCSPAGYGGGKGRAPTAAVCSTPGGAARSAPSAPTCGRARRKLADGWTYGPALDDDARRHPDLVPYDQLPEDKKAYDRDTALETLKLILALGYQIVPLPG
jgi:hypothetical protein